MMLLGIFVALVVLLILIELYGFWSIIMRNE